MGLGTLWGLKTWVGLGWGWGWVGVVLGLCWGCDLAISNICDGWNSYGGYVLGGAGAYHNQGDNNATPSA